MSSSSIQGQDHGALAAKFLKDEGGIEEDVTISPVFMTSTASSSSLTSASTSILFLEKDASGGESDCMSSNSGSPHHHYPHHHTSKTSSSSRDVVLSLPQEVTLHRIFEFLSLENLSRAAMATCRGWRKLAQGARFWEAEVRRQWPGLCLTSRGDHSDADMMMGEEADDHRYYKFYVRQRLAVSRAVEGEGWWSRYTLMLRLIDRESGAILFSKSQELGGDFEADVTGHANYSIQHDVEYSGYLITPPASGYPPSFTIRPPVGVSIREWFLCPTKLHAECMLLDRQTGSMACVYATQERDIRDGRMIVEEGGSFQQADEEEDEEEEEEGMMDLVHDLPRRIEVIEVFKRNPTKKHSSSPFHARHQLGRVEHTWSRLHYNFSIMDRTEEDGSVAVQVQHCALLLEGLQRKPRPYSYDDGSEWRAVKQWAQGLDWC